MTVMRHSVDQRSFRRSEGPRSPSLCSGAQLVVEPTVLKRGAWLGEYEARPT